jgi:lipase ATG15
VKAHVHTREQSQPQLTFETIKYLAEMSYDAYIKINGSGWYDFDATPFIKGYIFWHDNRYIISLKGTSLFIGSAKDDRFNDNLFFSCCYYKQSNLFRNTCDIKTPEHTCSKSCYTDSLNFESNYLNVLNKISVNLEPIINSNNVIFTGHSLGGLMATYLAIKYNKTAVTFETPGTRHYFDSVSLDYSGASDKIFHFGHTSDPIFMGNCNLRSSLCYIGGYILRTKCHVGNTCIYDSKNKLNMTPSILKHRMGYIIKNIISQWKDDFPVCEKNITCSDCEQWATI